MSVYGDFNRNFDYVYYMMFDVPFNRRLLKDSNPMQPYPYNRASSNSTSLFDLIFDNLTETSMDNDTIAQDEQTVTAAKELKVYPLRIKVAGKLAVMYPHKRDGLGYKCRIAIDEAIDEGFVDGSLTLKHNLTDSMSSLQFMKDVDGLRWDTHFMEITGPQKAFEIIRNMGFTNLACGDDLENNRYMCQITNVYTDEVIE